MNLAEIHYICAIMTNAFKVAGHTFCLSMPDNCSLWEHLDPYTPFKTDSADGALFTVDLCQSVPEGERELVYDAPTEPGETVVRLYRQGQDWIFEMSPDKDIPICGILQSNADFSEGRLAILSRRMSQALFSVNNALMLMYAFSTITLNTLEMHASVISNGGKAYLFLGKSGTGKSTHSRMWLENIPGSTLMNDDNPIVRALPDGRVVAYGSPWSGKTPCYKNEEAPVGAFVRIRQCPRNEISRMSVIEAYATLYSSCSGLKTDRMMADGLHATLEQVVLGTPVYLLDCLPDADAAKLCHSTVSKAE